MIAEYYAKYGIFGTIAKAEGFFEYNATNYKIYTVSKALGIAAVLSKHMVQTYSSIGIIKNNRLIPTAYISTRKKGNNFYKRIYLFDHKNKKITRLKYKNSKLEANETLTYYTPDDILSLYFNLPYYLKQQKKSIYTFYALGGRKKDGKIDVTFLKDKELKKVKKDNLIVVGIEREKDFFIPSDEDILKEGDLIYFFGEQIALKEISFKLNTLPPSAIKKVAIFGADLLGIEIAKVFIKKRAEIKLIDKNPSLCQKAADILQNKVMVINSKYIEHSLYEDENIKNADMIVTTSNEDEENIIKSLEAKEFGVKKVVAINNNLEYYDLMHRLKITPVRGPKSSAYYQILEKIGSSAIITEKHYCGGRGAVFVRKIFENSSLIGKKIRPLKVSGCLNFLVRNGKIESFIAPIFAKKGDVLILFLKSRLEERAKEWIYSL